MQPPTCTLVPKPASLEELIQKAKTFVAAAKAPATLRAYRNDWRDFESWCREHQLTALPSTPETVALYSADRASTLASGTITRRLTSNTPRRTRPPAALTLRPQPAILSSARLSKESAARSVPRSTERTRFSQQTSAGSLLPGVKTFWAFETQL